MAQSKRPDISGLSYFIKEILYSQWKQNRSKALELKWQRNLDAYCAVSTSFWKSKEAESWRSSTFINVTKMKVMAAWSMVIDMLLQGGKVPFMLKPSPLDVVNIEEMPPEERAVMEEDITDMQKQIDQQLLECNADRQLMKCVLSGAIYGESYSKRYVHEVTRRHYQALELLQNYPGAESVRRKYRRFQEIEKQVLAPAVEYVSLWDIFRDLETDNLQKSAGFIHRKLLCPYDLRQMVGQPYFIPAALARAIRSSMYDSSTKAGGFEISTLPPGLRGITHRINNIQYLEFWGRVPRNIAEDFERTTTTKGDLDEVPTVLEPPYSSDGDEVEISCSIAGDEVVRYIRTSPVDRPLHRAEWEINLDGIGGLGVSDNLEDIQVVLNGAVRAFEDNKKLSANVILAIKKYYLDWDGKLEVGKAIEIADDCDDARKALQQIIIQDVGNSLITLIHLMERYADEASLLPKIIQGQTAEKRQPDTAYEISQLMQNAGKYLGGVIKNYDEGLIEPWIQDFYRYNMLDPDVTQGKGNFIVQALGFTSFQDKIVRLQSLQRFLALAMSYPQTAAEIRVRTIMEEIAKGSDIDPDQALKTKEEKDQDMKQAAEQQQQMLEAARQEKMIEAEADQALEKVKGDMKIAARRQDIDGKVALKSMEQFGK